MDRNHSIIDRIFTRGDDDRVVRIPKAYAGIEVRADTVNEDDRSVEVIWGTEAPVKRYNWEEGYYLEVLAMEPSAIRMERFTNGMSLLDTHDAWSMDARLGTVVPGSVRIEGKRGYATIRFSRREKAEEIFQDLRDGHPIQISVGYKIHKFEKSEGDENSLPTLRAVDWEPMELSVVPVPADAGAHSRSNRDEELFDCVFPAKRTTQTAHAAETRTITMNRRDAAKSYNGEHLDAFAMGFGLVRAAGESDDAFRARLLAKFDTEDAERAAAEEATRRAAEQAQQRTEQNLTPNAGLTEADAHRVAAEAVAADRRRTVAIETLAARHGIDDRSFVRQHIDGGSTEQQFRDALLDHIATRQERSPTFPVQSARVLEDEREKRREAIGNALDHRISPGAVTLTDAGRNFRGMTMIEIARDVLTAEGISCRGMERDEIARRAFHSSSDFPIILEGVINRQLRSGYAVMGQTFKAWAKRTTATDFRDMYRIQVGEVGDLKKLNEHGEYESTTLGEGSEKYRIATYGRKVGVTRQMIVNDDLGVFASLPAKFGNAVARLESKVVYSVIINNQKLSDNVALFHATHNNLKTGAPISLENMAAARVAMTKHKGLNQRDDTLDISPKFLLHAPELEFEVAKLLGQISPSKIADVAPEYIRNIVPISEARLSAVNGGTSWWFVADYNQVDTVEYAYLAGNEGPYVETRTGFDIDGMETKIRLDFGAAAIDYRGMYQNNAA